MTAESDEMRAGDRRRIVREVVTNPRATEMNSVGARRRTAWRIVRNERFTETSSVGAD